MVKNLRALRQRANLSQRALGEAVGVSQQTINKYENHGTQPDLDTLIALAEVFHTTVDALVGHDVEGKAETTPDLRLSREEEQLVESWRTLTKKQKQSLKLILEAYEEKRSSHP